MGSRTEFDPIHKLAICNYVEEYKPNMKQALQFAKEVTGRSIGEPTLSSMLRANHLQIKKKGCPGRPVNEDSIEISPPDRLKSSLVHISIRALCLIITKRNRPSRNVDMEVRMLEQIYHVLSSGQRLITEGYLRYIVLELCRANPHHQLIVSKFLRDLKRKYYLANKVYLYLDKIVTYSELLDRLEDVYPSLCFASRNPPIVKDVAHEQTWAGPTNYTHNKSKNVKIRDGSEQLPKQIYLDNAVLEIKPLDNLEKLCPTHTQLEFEKLRKKSAQYVDNDGIQRKVLSRHFTMEQLEKVYSNVGYAPSFMMEQFTPKIVEPETCNSDGNKGKKAQICELPVSRLPHQDHEVIMPVHTITDWEDSEEVYPYFSHAACTPSNLVDLDLWYDSDLIDEVYKRSPNPLNCPIQTAFDDFSLTPWNFEI